FALVLIAGMVAGVALERAYTIPTLRRVSGRDFLSHGADFSNRNSTLMGVTRDETAYILFRTTGHSYIGPYVVWTPLSEMPPDIAKELREGKNPWARE